MHIGLVDLLVLGLATWRITSILHCEKISGCIRKGVGAEYTDTTDTWTYPDTFLGNLFACFWCLSVWIGLGCVISWWLLPEVLYPFAVSAVAILISEKI